MARNNGQIIKNYRTTGVTKPLASNVEYGEIVVQYNSEEPKLYIKKENDEIAEFASWEKIESVILEDENRISELETNLEKLEDETALINADLADLSCTLESDEKVIASSLTNLNTKLSGLSETVESAITGVYEYVNEDEAVIAKALTSLNVRVDEVEEAVKSLPSGFTEIVERIEGEINDLKETVTSDEEITAEALIDVNGRLSNAESDITKLGGDVTKLGADVADIDIALIDVNERLSNAESDITKLDADVTDIDIIVSKALTDLNERVANLSETLKNDEEEITLSLANLNADLENKQGLITEYNKLSSTLIDGLSTVATSGSYNDLSDKPTIPAIPNIATVIDSQSTDTDTAGAKAVYNAINPAIITVNPNDGFVPNVMYNISTPLTGNVTFTLASPTDATVTNHYFFTFNTDTTAPTVTWPNGITWQGGSAPTINASKHYEISILNNYGVAMEV